MNLLVAVLAERRRALGMRQEDVAALIGVRQGEVSNWERGAADPRLVNLERYAAAVGGGVAIVFPVSEDTCGGCRGLGNHRRHCPRHPDYHPWKALAARAESVGDSIGVPELANRAWGLAAAIREAMPDHPWRGLKRSRW